MPGPSVVTLLVFLAPQGNIITIIASSHYHLIIFITSYHYIIASVAAHARPGEREGHPREPGVAAAHARPPYSSPRHDFMISATTIISYYIILYHFTPSPRARR